MNDQQVWVARIAEPPGDDLRQTKDWTSTLPTKKTEKEEFAKKIFAKGPPRTRTDVQQRRRGVMGKLIIFAACLGALLVNLLFM